MSTLETNLVCGRTVGEGVGDGYLAVPIEMDKVLMRQGLESSGPGGIAKTMQSSLPVNKS